MERSARKERKQRRKALSPLETPPFSTLSSTILHLDRRDIPSPRATTPPLHLHSIQGPKIISSLIFPTAATTPARLHHPSPLGSHFHISISPRFPPQHRGEDHTQREGGAAARTTRGSDGRRTRSQPGGIHEKGQHYLSSSLCFY